MKAMEMKFGELSERIYSLMKRRPAGFSEEEGKLTIRGEAISLWYSNQNGNIEIGLDKPNGKNEISTTAISKSVEGVIQFSRDTSSTDGSSVGVTYTLDPKNIGDINYVMEILERIEKRVEPVEKKKNKL